MLFLSHVGTSIVTHIRRYCIYFYVCFPSYIIISLRTEALLIIFVSPKAGRMPTNDGNSANIELNWSWPFKILQQTCCVTKCAFTSPSLWILQSTNMYSLFHEEIQRRNKQRGACGLGSGLICIYSSERKWRVSVKGDHRRLICCSPGSRKSKG